MPVYNEGPNIGRALEEIYQHVLLAKRVLIVYDFDEDNTVPVVRELAPRYPGVELIKNTLGRGVVNAVRAGIAATTAEVVIVTMADLSDDLRIVPRMVELDPRRGVRHRLRFAVHEGGPADRRAALEGLDVADRGREPVLAGGTADARRDQRLPRLPPQRAGRVPDREPGGVRLLARDHGQGVRGGPADHGGPLHLARPLGGHVAVPAPRLAAPLPPLVSLRADPSTAPILRTQAAPLPVPHLVPA